MASLYEMEARTGVSRKVLRDYVAKGWLPDIGACSAEEFEFQVKRIRALRAGMTPGQVDGFLTLERERGGAVMGQHDSDGDVRDALVFASRFRDEVARCVAPGMAKAQIIEVEANAWAKVRSEFPDYARSWDRAHSAMSRGVAVHSGQSATFQEAKNIALGRTFADATRVDPGAVELCRKAGILSEGDLKKLDQTGHAGRLAKNQAADNYRTAPKIPAGIPWAALTAWYDGYGAREVGGMEGGAVLAAFKEGRMPSVYRVTFGHQLVTDPGEVNWSGFENRYGDITSILGARQKLEPKFPVTGGW